MNRNESPVDDLETRPPEDQQPEARSGFSVREQVCGWLRDAHLVWWFWRHHALKRWWRVVFMGGGRATAGKIRRVFSAAVAILASSLLFGVFAALMAIITLRLEEQTEYATIAGALAAVINLYALGRVGTSLGGAVGTLFDSHDLAQLQTMPIGSRHLFVYKLFQDAFLHGERSMPLMLAGTLFGYGLGYVQAEVASVPVTVVAIALCFVVSFLAVLCIAAGCTALQMAISLGIVRGLPAPWRNLIIVAVSVALIVGFGALYRNAFGRLPFNPQLFEEYSNTVDTAVGTNTLEGLAIMVQAVGKLIGPVVGPIVQSSAWQLPPGGLVSRAVDAAASGQPAAMLGALLALLGLASIIVGLSTVLAGGGYRYARSQMTSGGTARARGGRIFSFLYKHTQRIASNRWLGKLLPPIAAAAFTREIVCIGRETKRMLRLSGVVVLLVSALGILVSRQSWARRQGVAEQQLGLGELVGELSAAPGLSEAANWSLLLMLLYVLVAGIGWAVPSALGASSVGLDGRAGMVWASQAGGMRQAVRGKWWAYFVLGTLIGCTVEIVALRFIGPFYWTGFGVGFVCVIAFSAASSAFMVGTSGSYARFWWDHHDDATRRGSQASLFSKAFVLVFVWPMVAYLVYEILLLQTAMPVTWAVAASCLVWIAGAILLAWWTYWRGAKEVAKVEW